MFTLPFTLSTPLVLLAWKFNIQKKQLMGVESKYQDKFHHNFYKTLFRPSFERFLSAKTFSGLSI